MKWAAHGLIGCVAVLLGACAQLPSAPEAGVAAGAQACHKWFTQLDHAIEQAGVGDAQEARIPGYPHLRSNRFTAALAADLNVSDLEYSSAVLPQMRELDRAARGAELRNLPAAAVAALSRTRGELIERSDQCASQLLQAPPPARNAVRVPDDYHSVLRFFGLYPLTRYPFTWGVEAELRRTRAAFLAPLPASRVVRYVTDQPAMEVAPVPVFEKEIASGDDLAGGLAWNRAGDALELATEAPTIYVQHGLTRYHGQTLRQVSYQIWWGARPATVPGDLLAGHLDGLIWRVTLNPQGRPLIYDTIHPCGCYHLFFTTPRARPVAAPPDEPEWAFVAQELPDLAPGERLVLRITAGTQQLVRVSVQATPIQEPVATALLSLDVLRSLPLRGAGAARSAYGPDGLVAGTERAERFLFWPMGIAAAGQMRQWGRHASAFVGRRHFDDADLFEKRFVFKLEP